MPRKLLLISYLFPPVGGVGVQRALSLAKYLPDCGFDVHVLSASNATAPVIDPGLLKQIPSSVTQHQAFTPEISYALRQTLWKKLSGSNRAKNGSGPPRDNAPSGKSLLKRVAGKILSPEPEILWKFFALPKARRIVSRYKIDAVLVTAPPFTSFLIGNSLKREFPGIALVSDFRDEWLDYYLSNFGYQNSEATRNHAAAIERATVELSDRVVSVTNGVLSKIRTRYPDQPDKKFALIPNGYDPRMFETFTPRPHNTGNVVFTFLGTVFKPTSPRSYLDALDQLPEEVRSRIETRFIGHIAPEERAVLSSRKSLVRLLGVMPQEEAFRALEETDYLLLNLDNDFCLTGKLFEYLAARKPIFAVAPVGSEVDRMLQETGAGCCTDPEDQPRLRERLLDAFRLARSKQIGFPVDQELIRRYQRPVLAADYGRLIESCIPQQT